MAGILSRTTLVASKLATKQPGLLVVAARNKSYPYGPDPMEHATGLERKELEAIARGNPDPFGMKVLKRGPGTKDQPNLIPSFYEMRLVGCVCHEDAFYLNYMWLYKGEPKRCECGHWFKLVEAEDPFKDIPDFHVKPSSAP